MASNTVTALSAGLSYRHNECGTTEPSPNTTAAAVLRPVVLLAARLYSPSFAPSYYLFHS